MKFDISFIKENILLFIVPLFVVGYCIYTRKWNLDMIHSNKPLLPENDVDLGMEKVKHALQQWM